MMLDTLSHEKNVLFVWCQGTNMKRLVLLCAVLIVLITNVNAENVIVVLKEQPKAKNLNKLKIKTYCKQRDLIDMLKKRGIKFKRFWIVNALEINATKDVLDTIRKRNDVLYVIPDYKVKLLETDVLWNIKWIKADDVWKLGVNGSGVKVAVVDTGIAQHPDLAGKIVAWKDFVNGRTEPYDDNGHGTHVAGIIAGNYTGVAPGVKLIGVKVLDSSGSGSISTIIDGFQWAVESGAKIVSFSAGVLPYDTVNGFAEVNGSFEVNVSVHSYMYEPAYEPASIVVCSSVDVNVSLVSPTENLVKPNVLQGTPYTDKYCWAYTPSKPLVSGTWRIVFKTDTEKDVTYDIYIIYSSVGNSTIDRAVNNLVENGVVVVCAAGNEGFLGYRTIDSPASANGSIAVGALSYMSNDIAFFSSKGPVGYDENETIKPDVVAPGVNINSTYINGGYFTMSGTSMATPHVSGVVALMLQVNPNLTPKEIKDILKKTATDLGMEGCDNVYGCGVVNAYYAVLNATVKGDFNFNGKVDIGDVSVVAGMVVGKVKPDLRADFNGNGRIDIGDLAKIWYYANDLIDTL